MPLAAKLKGKLRPNSRKGPIWDGPESDTPNGGITQSLLSRFICCRERFRLLVVEGLAPEPMFDHKIEFGQMWHVYEEALAKSSDGSPVTGDAPATLRQFCKTLCQRYPTQQEQVEHWYKVCCTQFPIYVDWWSKHKDVKNRTPIFQEKVFSVPYELPSGRNVILRGKFDSVDQIGTGRAAGIYLQENKTKSDIVEQQLKRQLAFDLQTMIYLAALQRVLTASKIPINGVRYNVVRRPLSGGRGSIRQLKPTKKNPRGESKEAFYKRVGDLIKAEPEHFFMRWKVEVTKDDIYKFQQRCLNPLLEQLVEWWDWVSSPEGKKDPFAEGTVHWQTPYGFWNALAEKGSTEMDEYLASGSKLGLTKVPRLFTELDV